MRDVLQLTLLGSAAVRFNGHTVTGFRSSKAQALLYYLAVAGRPHTRPTLAGLLWGDQPEAMARGSLTPAQVATLTALGAAEETV